MKRRLRALAREVLPGQGVAGADHVLIGRENGIERDFAALKSELEAALARAVAGKGDPPRRSGPRSGIRGKPHGRGKGPTTAQPPQP
jgi:ribonuclease P protein component